LGVAGGGVSASEMSEKSGTLSGYRPRDGGSPTWRDGSAAMTVDDTSPGYGFGLGRGPHGWGIETLGDAGGVEEFVGDDGSVLMIVVQTGVSVDARLTVILSSAIRLVF
jgi:hypothetical protein